jgi:outer membrane protein OmpA-like peptidoglycan-associated protein
MKKHYYLAIFLVLFSFSTQAQDWLGIDQMNNSGVNTLEVNPANIADNRLKVDIMLGGATFGVYNNYAGISRANATDTSLRSDNDFFNKYVEWNDNGDDKSIYVSNRIYLPSVMFGIGEKMAAGFTWQVRTMVNIDGVGEDLALLLRNNLEYEDLWQLDLVNDQLSAQFNSWAEYGFNFGMVAKDDGEHFLKWGTRVKVLQGLGAGYAYVDQLSYNFTDADTLSISDTQVDYGHSSNFEYDTSSNSNPIEYKLISKLGLGLDVGVIYEWRPDWQKHKYDMDGRTNVWNRNQNKYKLKVGFSMTDLGRIKYDKGEFSNSFVAEIQDLPIDTIGDVVSDVESWDQWLDTFQTAENDNRTFNMTLPTTFSLQIDYNVYKDFYLNFTPQFAMQMKKNGNKTHFFSNYALTPRWDHKWFGIAVPVSISSLTGFRIGTGLRMGPIIIGTSNLNAISKDKAIRGLDFYAAVKIPIHYGHPKDNDKDLVSNKLDECIDVPGVWGFMGCPDTDGDGIVDTKDDCPAEAGTLEFNGCPDTDGDKIIDRNDDCAEVAGLAEFNGCPDTDGDGLKDSDDDCPTEAGPIEQKGCPDRDSDGIIDSEDLCPDNAGPEENDGCPDTDGDGIFDYLDECVTVPGPGENRGCPYPDTDGDGLLDKDDLCPNNAGPVENQGCPYTDTDGDGVLDKDDRCPNVPGVVENQGCPVIEEAEQEILNTAFENLEFQSGKDIIENSSFPSLVELAGLLKDKPTWKLLIAGHTDSQGAERTNLILSKKRSEAVKKFLIDNGVTEANLTVEYFGETKPIADNDTAEGRQKNRRVEMTVEFE